jgi:hypothetical protein
MNCPLCHRSNPDFFHFDQDRSYYRCQQCLLICVDSKNLPEFCLEKERYQQHNNNPSDQGYVEFMYSFINPLVKRISQQTEGLDYGSGPTPVLAELLEKEGYHISVFDPFFANDRNLLAKQYDYLTCVETAEHFHYPAKDWQIMTQLVKKGGWLGVKTSMFNEKINFSLWHYKRDFTHVCFYSKETFGWIAQKFELIPHFEDDSTVFFEVR